MSTEIAIIKTESIATIIADAPQAYQGNVTSHDRCITAGQQLLDTVKEQGMSDELDQQVASYIEKARKTVKKMNEARSPFTKMFDEMRKAFTTIENDIDPTKAGTIPYQLQGARNAYATQKRAEEEARMREAIAKRQAEEARQQMHRNIEEDLKEQFQNFLQSAVDRLTKLDESITLDNFEEKQRVIEATDTILPPDYIPNLRTTIALPKGVQPSELTTAEDNARNKLATAFAEQYQFEVLELKNFILDRLPSKQAHLQRIAQANAEEAQRLQAELEAKQKAEAQRIEAERQAREAEQQQREAMQKQAEQMTGLFDTQATIQTYQPNTKVSEKIQLLNPEGILPILSLWFAKEGCTLTTEELHKMFKKQITFCEKLAKQGEYIRDESVQYVEEVKAK